MDVSLNDLNAVELTNSIRSGIEFSDNYDIPIIGLSANADSFEMKENITAGMNDFIIKPINIELLFRKMNELTSKKTHS
jgi:CheY-like chemotaxis protein